MSELFARFSAAVESMAPRERLLVGLAAGLALIMLLWFAVVTPMTAAKRNAELRADSAEREVGIVRELREEFDAVNGRLASVEQRIHSAPKGEIFTALEQLARQSQVSVDSMEPQRSPPSDSYQETKVRVSLKGQSLAQVTRYLNGIETAEQLLSIKSLRIRTQNGKPELLDVTFTVSSFEPI